MLLHVETSEVIIGAAFEVYNQLGFGFLEKVYQRAMQVELTERGYKAIIEYPIKVKYKDVFVGEYFADILVNDIALVELKVTQNYNSKDEAQLLNQLKATERELGILINFGKEKVEFKRLVY